MKRILVALLLVLVLSVMLIACGDITTDGSNTTNSEGSNQQNINLATSSKYNYDLSKYITIPSIKDYVVNMPLDEIQKGVDKHIVEYSVKSSRDICRFGDVVNVECIRNVLDESGNMIEGDQGQELKLTMYLGSFIEDARLERAVVGMSIGGIKNLVITFDEGHSDKELAGKTFNYEIVLKSIYETQIYDDAFVREYFEYDSRYDFEDYLKTTFVLTRVYEYLSESSVVISYPEKEYNEKAQKLKDVEDDFFENNKIELDNFLFAEYGMTRDEYIKSEMKKDMIFYAIAQTEEIQITKAMLENERTALTQYYKALYLEQYETMTEATALSKAEKFVNDLGNDYLYENVIFDEIDSFLSHAVKVNETERTYKSITEALAERDEKIGSEIGDYCPSHELEQFDGEGLKGTMIDPSENLGKITIINMWGTWCGPCKSELPDFDKFATDYSEYVTVYAIHSHNNFRDAAKYVKTNFPDSKMIFLKDTLINPKNQYDGEVYFDMLGGTDSYPYTVILDEFGQIIYQHVGMMSYDELKGIVDNQLGFEKAE